MCNIMYNGTGECIPFIIQNKRTILVFNRNFKNGRTYFAPTLKRIYFMIMFSNKLFLFIYIFHEMESLVKGFHISIFF